MNLRHKKPINSYKGQTNNDKSEFNDDDFKQQGSPQKKNATGSTDQIYKYAKILSKFVKIINQDNVEQNLDYRTFDYSNTDQRPSDSHQKRIDKIMMEQENQMSLSYGKTEQNKQIKQLAKLQQRIQIKQNPKIFKTSHPPKDELPLPHLSKPPTPPPPKIQETPLPFKDKKKPIDLKDNYVSKQSLNKDKKQIGINFNKSQSNGLLQKGNNILPKVQPNNSIQPSINFVDSNLLNYFNMSGILPQNVFQGGMPIFGVNQLNINQLLGQYPGQANAMRDSGLGVNLGVIGINGLSMNASQLYPKPIQNLFTEQVKNYNTDINNNVPKNQLDKAYAKKVYPLKRNAYHVTIAYKIYLDKLKKDGVNIQNLQDIDPTKNARKIKSNQGSKGNNKQSAKKKK